MKTCKTCLKPEADGVKFGPHRYECNRCRGRDYYARNREKVKEATLARYHANPELYRERAKHWASKNPERRRENFLRWRYGITVEEYDAMFERQEGLCAICSVPRKRFHVDHDHETKRVRGLLCNNCNTGIGMFQDNPTLLRLASMYVV